MGIQKFTKEIEQRVFDKYEHFAALSTSAEGDPIP